jgi:hypothetical protein
VFGHRLPQTVVNQQKQRDSTQNTIVCPQPKAHGDGIANVHRIKRIVEPEKYCCLLPGITVGLQHLFDQYQQVNFTALLF